MTFVRIVRQAPRATGGHLRGNGSPEGVVIAPVGKVYERADTAAHIHPLWFKLTGAGATGWRNMVGRRVGDSSIILSIDSDDAGVPLATMQLGGGSETRNIFLYRFGDANRFSNAGVAAITLSFPDADTPADSAGSRTRFDAARGRGTGTPGKFIFRTSTLGTTGTTIQTLADRFEIESLEIRSHELLNFPSATAAKRAIRMNGVQVLTDRRTGWTAATGTATRTAFATGTVTTAQLAERVKALLDDLIAHGIIGT